MCVHIYYAYSILSNFQEKLETLVKFKLGYSYSSSYNCFGLHANKEKNCTHTSKHINLHTYTHTKKVFFLAFVYRLLEIFTQKYFHYVLRMIIFKYSQTFIPLWFLQCKRCKQRFAKKCQLSANSSTPFSEIPDQCEIPDRFQLQSWKTRQAHGFFQKT